MENKLIEKFLNDNFRFSYSKKYLSNNVVVISDYLKRKMVVINLFENIYIQYENSFLLCFYQLNENSNIWYLD